VTFTELVDEVAARLNLTSDEALTRIGRGVNDVYQEVVSTINLETSSRATTIGVTEEDSRFMTFGEDEELGGIIKVLAVWDPDYQPPSGILGEISVDEMRNQPLGSWPPRNFAVYRIGNNSVTIFLDCEAPEADLELYADVLESTTTLTGEDTPAFPANFHDLIVYGAQAIELNKMEKYDMGAVMEAKYEKRLADLRYFIASSAYRRIHQGKTTGWNVPGPWLVGS
jgi:hypothetical protein